MIGMNAAAAAAPAPAEWKKNEIFGERKRKGRKLPVK